MSLMGEPFDSILGALYDLVGGIIGLAGALIAIIGKLITIIYYILTFLEIVVSIVLNPYLLALFIMGTAFYYAVFTAKTRKELMIQTGTYYKFVILEALPKAAYAIYTIVIRIVTGIIDMI